MATNRLALLIGLTLLAGGAAHSREAASPAACQAAAQRPVIVNARSAVASDRHDVRSNFALADAWSEAGCFAEAAQALQEAVAANPGNPQLATRLRVARSLVGEEHFFDNIDRAETAARLKRDLFRCTSLSDLDACNEAARLAPTDSAVAAARAEALARIKKPGEAAPVLAAAAAPAQAHAKTSDRMPLVTSASRRYSNAAPEGQSH
jgi:hypothetical protein